MHWTQRVRRFSTLQKCCCATEGHCLLTEVTVTLPARTFPAYLLLFAVCQTQDRHRNCCWLVGAIHLLSVPAIAKHVTDDKGMLKLPSCWRTRIKL